MSPLEMSLRDPRLAEQDHERSATWRAGV